MNITVLTPPTIEPVSLAEVRAHCRVDESADDGLLAGYVLAARQYVESFCGVVLMTSTLRGTADAFPSAGPLTLPVHPVQSVTAVRYYDDAGALQTWSASAWETDLTGINPRVGPKAGYGWPTPAARLGAVQVEFVAGYGASPGAIPEQIRQRILLMVGHFYANREEVVVGAGITATKLPFIDALLAPFRTFN
jgi:uncharacterized phiE125 gp8 family phage protein